jgi:hypothetical protein
VPYAVPYNTWQRVRATVKSNSDGSVTLALFSGNTLLVSATDDGSIGGPPITSAGRVGLRGDNADLQFDDFTVTDLTPSAPPTTPIDRSPKSGEGSQRNHAYPAAWKMSENSGTPIRFQGLDQQSTVKIFERTGQLISSIDAASGSAVWDPTGPSGVYMYVATDADGRQFRGKLVVIK